jgi:hypothetical protein
VSVIFGSLGGVGLLVSLALRWTDLLVLQAYDDTRRYCAGYQFYDCLGAPGGLLTAMIGVAGLGAICASGNGDANIALGCGVLAFVTVAVSFLALTVIGPVERSERGYIGVEPHLELGGVIAGVSAVLALVGGLLAWRERRLTSPA